jgi:hypothetical protein
MRDERGVALPMALFTLLLLTSLSLAFMTLGQSEPVISNNHLRTAQARALAEAGVERAIWALSNTQTTGVATPAINTVWGSPYDGTKYFKVSDRGGFVVWVKGGQTDAYQAVVQSVGRVVTGTSPADQSTYNSSDSNLSSAHRIKVTVGRFPEFGLNAPCALCVNGDLVVKGNATISSTADTSCGNKYGVGVTTGSSLCIGGDNACSESDPNWANNGSVNGATGSSTAPNDASDYTRTASMTNTTLSTSQLDALKQIAKSLGTYYSTGTTSTCGDGTSGTQSCTPCSSGTCSFSASNKLPSGKSIVFIDGNYDASGNPYQNDAFNGWVIVNGSATLNGNGTINGLVYALNDISSSSGSNTINGLVISANTTNATGIDSSAGGSMNINFNCSNASGNNNFAKKWFPVPGTWKEKTGRAVDATDYP